MSVIGSREQTLVYFRSDYARVELSDFIRDRCGRGTVIVGGELERPEWAGSYPLAKGRKSKKSGHCLSDRVATITYDRRIAFGRLFAARPDPLTQLFSIFALKLEHVTCERAYALTAF